MERIILLQKILSYLERLSNLISISNTSGDSSVSKVSEGLVCEILNIVYDANLTNCNLGISNYPAIDLHNEKNRISYQITSTKDVKKIKDTLGKFFKHKLYQKYDELYIIVLIKTNYDTQILTKTYNKILLDYKVKFNFDFNKHLIDISRLYNIISNLSDISKILKIESVLEKNFDDIKGRTDLSKYYNLLKDKFFEIVMDDSAGLTLNSIYVEPYFQIHDSCINKLTAPFNSKEGHFLDPKTPIGIHDFFNAKFNGNN